MRANFSYIAAAFALTACIPSEPKPPPLPAMTVDAMDVVETNIGGQIYLQGKFSIRPAKAGEKSLLNSQAGGACLLLEYHRELKSCERHSDCDRTVRSSPNRFPQKWLGYCLSNGLSGDLSGKRCWVKPPFEKMCLKNVGPGDYYTPPINPADFEESVRSAPSGDKRVYWMTYGCLNGPYTSLPAPCARGNTGDFIDDRGPIRIRPEPAPITP